MDDRLVCLVLMYRLEVAAKKPDEGIEPLEGLHGFQEEDVVSVSQADVFLFMGEDILTMLLIVLHVHHDVAEDAEGGDIAFEQHDGVALGIGVPQSTTQQTKERKDLHKGQYQHRSYTCQIQGCNDLYPCEAMNSSRRGDEGYTILLNIGLH